MAPLTLITYLDRTEAFDWGLRLEHFRGPTVVVAHPRFASDLSARDTGGCDIVYRALPAALTFGDALCVTCDLHRAGRLPTTHVLFCEAQLLYKHISFDLTYSGLLQRAFGRRGLLHHNLTDFVRSTGVLFTLNGVAAEDARRRLESDPTSRATGIGADPTRAPLPTPERDVEDVNLVAAPEIAGRTLHIVGDSHGLLTLTPNRVLGSRAHVYLELRGDHPGGAFDAQFTHHLGSRTMYGFSTREEAAPRTLTAFGVKPGDTVLFVLGEIDVRSHVFKHVGEGVPVEAVVADLTERYFRKIGELTQGRGVEAAVMGAIPPMDGPTYASEDYPIRGSLAQRVAATRLLNAALAEGCGARGMAYFELNDLYALPDGSLDLALSDHFCHVGHHFQDKAIRRMMDALNTGRGRGWAAAHPAAR